MGRIPEETIQAIRDRVDVVDLIGRYVTLKKAGRSFKGLCPFHQEKTASFTVNPERGIFHCFGCGESGNAIAFLMRHENLTFTEAARVLAAECGIEIPLTGGGEPGVAERILKANGVAQKLYREALMASWGEPARAYLERRGLGRELAERFGVGFAPDRWDAVTNALARQRIPASVGEKAGLLKERERGGHYDLLRGRITFPIQDVRGRVIGFGGRALRSEQEPKYLNTLESPVFRKRESFYGFPFALEPIRRSDRAVVVEGYFDLIALHRAGIEESVATCGTALTEGHARNLRRRTRNLVLLFDGDEAGQRAVLRALEMVLPQGLRVRAAALPSGEDPDDFMTRNGSEALRDLIDSAPPALDLTIQRALAGGCETPWEKADVVAAVAPLLVALPDPVERGEYTPAAWPWPAEVMRATWSRWFAVWPVVNRRRMAAGKAARWFGARRPRTAASPTSCRFSSSTRPTPVRWMKVRCSLALPTRSGVSSPLRCSGNAAVRVVSTSRLWRIAARGWRVSGCSGSPPGPRVSSMTRIVRCVRCAIPLRGWRGEGSVSRRKRSPRGFGFRRRITKRSCWRRTDSSSASVPPAGRSPADTGFEWVRSTAEQNRGRSPPWLQTRPEASNDWPTKPPQMRNRPGFPRYREPAILRVCALPRLARRCAPGARVLARRRARHERE
jgi:DNA primase